MLLHYLSRSYKNLKNIKFSDYIFVGILGLIIVTNIFISLFFIGAKPIDSDEFQHMHIVWNMFHNGKVIYRDFWEHHGVIYPVVNYLLFKALNLQADFSTFYVFRLVSFVYMVIILALTYAIASVTFKNKLVSLLSVAVLSSLFFFQIKGIEMRPDTLQNVFWLGGLYLVLAHIQKFNRYSFFLSGILFGLAFCTNTKAAFGIAFVFLFFLGELIFSKDHRKEILLRTGLILAGICTVQGVVLLCFAYLHGLHAYFESNFVFNVIEITRDSNIWVFPYFWDIFIHHQSPFIFGCAVSFLILIKNISKTVNTKITFLFLFVAIGSSLGILFGLYPQWYIIFLPLLSIVVAYGLVYLQKKWGISDFKKILVGALLILVFFLPMEYFLISRLRLIQTNITSPLLAQIFIDSTAVDEQKFNTNYILENANRSEVVGYFWNACGGFMFNEDAQYYWTFTRLHNDTVEVLVGYDVYGESFTNALAEKNVRYIVVRDNDMRFLYATSTAQYISDNYHRVNDCILERN